MYISASPAKAELTVQVSLDRFLAWRGAPIVVCAAFTVLAYALRLGLAVAHPSIFRPDEVFQALEPAHGLLTGQWIAAWEWLEGARTWLFPGLIVGPMAIARAAGLDAPAQVAAAWAVFAALGSLTVVMAFVLGSRHHGLLGGSLCALVCAIWPDLVYFGPKTLTEIQGGHLLVLAACLAALPGQTGDVARLPGWRRCLAVGFLLGSCFCVRFHLAIGVAAVAFWFGGRHVRQLWVPMLIGAAVPLVVTAIIDYDTWGVPFFPVWKNLHVQLFEREARELGTPSGSAYYLVRLLWEWGAAAVFVAVLFVAGARRSLPLVVTAAAVALSHTMLGYKEINYIYAAIELSLIVAALGTAEIVVQLSAATGGRVTRQAGGKIAIILWIGAAVATNASASFDTYWYGKPGPLAAAALLRNSQDLCGIGLFRVPWQQTAGYAWTDRGAPTYRVLSLDQLRVEEPAFNYMIVPYEWSNIIGAPFTATQCWQDRCVMRRDGECSDVAGLDHGLSRAKLRP